MCLREHSTGEAFAHTLRAFSQGCAWRPVMRAKLAKLSVETMPLASVRSSTKARTQLRAASVMSCNRFTSSSTPCAYTQPLEASYTKALH